MKTDLYINEANDYARDIGAPTWHPHVSVVHYDEVGAIRHTLNRYNVYGLFLQREFPEDLTYGVGRYHRGGGSLLALAPGQIGGKSDDGTRRQYHGWVLLFNHHFIHGSEIERRMASYRFFAYNANEALLLTPGEKRVLAGLMSNVREELKAAHGADESHDEIIRDYILLILDYCRRFYARQFNDVAAAGSDILSRFQQLLDDYYRHGLQRSQGLPSVKYCAGSLCLSPGYFGDIVRNALGESPRDYIRAYIARQAKSLLLSGMGVTQVAEQMGFGYPTHFTRLFKQITGQTPSCFQNSTRQIPTTAGGNNGNGDE